MNVREESEREGAGGKEGDLRMKVTCRNYTTSCSLQEHSGVNCAPVEDVQIHPYPTGTTLPPSPPHTIPLSSPTPLVTTPSVGTPSSHHSSPLVTIHTPHNPAPKTIPIRRASDAAATVNGVPGGRVVRSEDSEDAEDPVMSRRPPIAASHIDQVNYMHMYMYMCMGRYNVHLQTYMHVHVHVERLPCACTCTCVYTCMYDMKRVHYVHVYMHVHVSFFSIL